MKIVTKNSANRGRPLVTFSFVTKGFRDVDDKRINNKMRCQGMTGYRPEQVMTPIGATTIMGRATRIIDEDK